MTNNFDKPYEYSPFKVRDDTDHDLHDIPKSITTWHNVYKETTHHTRRQADIYAGYDRVCVYRIERDGDSGNPQIFVEDA